jgi:SAM-dependent methyltransferase
MRNESYGENDLSLLDRIIFYFRGQRVKKHLCDCDLIIDFGCGYNAHFLKWFISKFKVQEAIGIDLSVNKSLQNKKISFLKADLNEKINLQSNIADFIVSTAILEHLDNPNSNINEAYRLLKPGGRLILTTPAPKAKPVLEFLAYTLGLISKEEVGDHKHYFNRKEIEQLLIYSGFKRNNIKLKTFQLGLNNLVIAAK